MRFMGIDLGDKRIGIALSDEGAVIASPMETLPRQGNRKDIARLLEIAGREDVGVILVGLPLSLDGSEGPQAKKVGRFVEALRAETTLPVTTWDERLSTVTAEQVLIEADVSRAKRKQRIDQVAAAVILQSYLDTRQD